MPDIRMPNGTVIKNVPAGITKAQLNAKLAKNGYDLNRLTTPQQKPSAIENIPLVGGLIAPIADIPLSAVEGLSGTVKSISDVFGADNAVSDAADYVSKAAAALRSAGSREDAEIARKIQKDAEGKGMWEEVKAAARAFTYAPLENIASVAGSAVPFVAAGVATGGAGVIPAATMAGLGAASGVGTIKGAVYDAVYDEFVKGGASKADAEAAAERAQEYGGKNMDQIALGGAIGALASATGFPPQFARTIGANAAKNVAARVAAREAVEVGVRRNVLGGAAKSAAIEAAPEAVQGGQEQLSQNLALQREGFDVDTWKGVAGQAASEGIASLFLGGYGGAREARAENREMLSKEVAQELDAMPEEPTEEVINEATARFVQRGFSQEVADQIVEKLRSSKAAIAEQAAELEKARAERLAQVDADIGEGPDLSTLPPADAEEEAAMQRMREAELTGVEPKVKPDLNTQIDEYTAFVDKGQMAPAPLVESIARQYVDAMKTTGLEGVVAPERMAAFSQFVGNEVGTIESLFAEQAAPTTNDAPARSTTPTITPAFATETLQNDDAVRAFADKYGIDEAEAVDRLSAAATSPTGIKYSRGRPPSASTVEAAGQESLFGALPTQEENRLDKFEEIQQRKLEQGALTQEEREAENQARADEFDRLQQERAAKDEQYKAEFVKNIEDAIRRANPANAAYSVQVDEGSPKPYKIVGPDGELFAAADTLKEFEEQAMELTPYTSPPISAQEVEADSTTPTIATSMMQELTAEIDAARERGEIDNNQRTQLIRQLERPDAYDKNGRPQDNIAKAEAQALEAMSKFRNTTGVEAKAAEAELAVANEKLAKLVNNRMLNPIRSRLRSMSEMRKDEQLGAKIRIKDALKVLAKRMVIVVHGGSDFDALDPKKLGTGEPGNLRPLGNGFYGFVVDKTNPEEVAFAVDYARVYSEKYGRGTKAIHAFQLDMSDIETRFNGPIRPSLKGPKTTAKAEMDAAWKEFGDAPLGSDGWRKFKEARKKYEDSVGLTVERLPIGLTEVAVNELGRLERIGKVGLNDGDDKLVSAIQDALLEGKQQEVAARKELRDAKIDLAESRVSKYRRGEAQPGQVKTDVAKVRAAVDAIVSVWKGPPVVEVVQSVNDIADAKIRRAVMQDNATGAEGFVAPDGTVYLIADNLESVERAKAVLFHEALGHVGLERLFRDELDGVLGALYKSNGNVRAKTDAWLAANPEAYPKDKDQIARAVEEVLAEMSEAGQLKPTMLKRIAAIIRNYARKLGFNLAISDADVEAILVAGHERVVNGAQESTLVKGMRYINRQTSGVAPTPKYSRPKATPEERKKVEDAAAGLSDGARRVKNTMSTNGLADGIEEAADSAPILRNALINAKGTASDMRRLALKSMPSSGITNWLERKAPAVYKKAEELVDRVRKMNGLRVSLKAAGDDVVRDMEDFVRQYGSETLARAQFTNRINEVDFLAFKTVDEALAKHRAIKAIEDALLSNSNNKAETRKLIDQIKQQAMSATDNTTVFKDKVKLSTPILAHMNALTKVAIANDTVLFKVKQLAAMTQRIRDSYAVKEELAKQKGGLKLYKEEREYHKDMFEARQALLDERIESGQGEEALERIRDIRAKLMREMQSPDERQKKGDIFWDLDADLFDKEYFPALRDGQHWLRVEEDLSKGREEEFHVFESASELERGRLEVAKRLKENPEDRNVFKIGHDISELQKTLSETDDLMKRVFDIVGNARKEYENSGQVDMRDLVDSVFQTWLMTTPERSARRHFMHAKLIAGFSTNTLANLQRSVSTNANELTKLAYAGQVRLAVQEIKDVIDDKQRPVSEQAMLGDFARELEKRAEQEINPSEQNAFLNFINRTSFYYFLTSARTALTNFANIPMRVIPRFWREYGYAEGTAMWLKYMKMWDSLGRVKLKRTNMRFGDYLDAAMPNVNGSNFVKNNADLQWAMKAGTERGILMTTMDTMVHNDRGTSFKPMASLTGKAEDLLANVGKVMGFLFTGTENISRQATFYMAFELEMNKQKKENPTKPLEMRREAALQKAMRITDDTIGNFADWERPSITKGELTRGFFLFKMHPILQTKFMTGAFRDIIGAPLRGAARQATGRGKLTKEDTAYVAGALKEFSGVLMMAGLLGGVGALPFYTMMAHALAESFDDEDDEDVRKLMGMDPRTAYDADIMFRRWLMEKMGTSDDKDVDFADIFIGGVPGALTDTEISSTVSLDLVNMWYREPISGDSLDSNMIATGIANIAGLSMATQFLRGGEALYEGDIADGLKKTLPAFFRSWVTAYVNETEGVKNRKGDTIIPKEDIMGADTFRSVLGGRSLKLARWQDYYITASKNEKRIKGERQDILDDLEDKIRSGDIKSKEAFREFWKEEVVPFNRTYPDADFVITEDTVERSMKGRSARSERNIQGLQVTAKSAERRKRAAEPFMP